MSLVNDNTTCLIAHDVRIKISDFLRKVKAKEFTTLVNTIFALQMIEFIAQKKVVDNTNYKLYTTSALLLAEKKLDNYICGLDRFVSFASLNKDDVIATERELFVQMGYSAEFSSAHKKSASIKEIDTSVDNDAGSLGEGTFGLVSIKQIDGIDYALKTIKNEDGEEDLNYSFVRELSTLIECDHKNIVKVCGVSISLDAILLEKMDMDMNRFYRHNTSLTVTHSFQEWCTRELLEGLKYLQSHSIINRDIKPQNILIRGTWPDLEVKYCDFGLCRSRAVENFATNPLWTAVVCTLWYRPPELLLGSIDYDDSIDVWSLGCSLYEIFKGTTLFEGGSEIDQLYKIFMTLGTPTEKIWPGVTKLPEWSTKIPTWNREESYITHSKISPSVCKVIDSALTLNPSKRPTATYLLNLLKYI